MNYRNRSKESRGARQLLEMYKNLLLLYLDACKKNLGLHSFKQVVFFFADRILKRIFDFKYNEFQYHIEIASLFPAGRPRSKNPAPIVIVGDELART